MSPFIPSLSRPLQEYPAFFNRTTINWFAMCEAEIDHAIALPALDDAKKKLND